MSGSNGRKSMLLVFLFLLLNVSCNGDLYPMKEQIFLEHPSSESSTGQIADTGSDPVETGFESAGFVPTDSASTDSLLESDSDTESETDSSTVIDTDVRTGYSACLEEKICEFSEVEIDPSKRCNDRFAHCDVLFCEAYGNAKCTAVRSRECFDLWGELVLTNTKVPPLASPFCPEESDTFCCIYDEFVVEDRPCGHPSHCGPPEQCIAEGLTPMVSAYCPDSSCCLDPQKAYIPL